MQNLLQHLLNKDTHRPRTRGQAMVLIALAFVGLAAFIGLTVDAGILFIQIGHLRRAVDSASLAAANQFRENRTVAEMEAAADEFINLNSLNPADAEVFICDLDNPTASNPNSYHDLDLCPEDLNGNGWHGPKNSFGGVLADNDEIPRKFIRVEATMPVEFSFLPVIGFGSIDIRAEAISEAASVDVVLAIDTSESMAHDAECGDKDLGDPYHDDPDEYDDDAWAEINLPGGLGFADGEDDCTSTGGVIGGFADDYLRDPAVCNDVDPALGIQGQCQPFEYVRTAALQLVTRMNFPYDRLAVVKFDRDAPSPPPASLSPDPSAINSAIGNLTVFKLFGCPSFPPDPGPCTSTNIADGLKVAGNQFGLFFREEAVPIVILLSDGAANAARDSSNNPICPAPGSPPAGNPTWVQPFCRDPKFEEAEGDYGYDAEDAAVDQGYFVGCPEGISFDPSETTCASPGQGAVVFTIGLGDKMINNTDQCDAGAYPGGCEEDQGEKLLRYIAAIGDDGDPSTNPCMDSLGNWLPKGDSCGNYYFSPTGAELLPVFEAIASRIFTRITH